MQSTRTGIHLLNGAVHRYCPFWRSNGKHLLLKVTCQPDDVVTPPARLFTLAKRLDTMLQAVKLA